ncbi:MAG: amidohydrolase [Dehalococcoidales bacterium]|nr:MAG: amidohydrolase [Dehalococcoidales bacterium]
MKSDNSFYYNMAMIIDFHTHIFSPRIRENRGKYINADPCFAGLYSDSKAKLITADELIESMDSEGIDISVILNIGWNTHELCIETNDYILESIARFPNRLVGFGSVQPRFLDPALKEIERCAQGGIRGIGELRPDVQQFNLLDKESEEGFFEFLVEQELILLTHTSEPVGHQYQGKGSVTPDILYSFITDYPDLKIVCAHWGGGLPFYALMPEVKKAMGNVLFDTAASPFLYSPQIYTQVIDLVGPGKILFGTDFPLLKPGRLLGEIDSLGLPEETRQMILEDNARNLLGI